MNSTCSAMLALVCFLAIATLITSPAVHAENETSAASGKQGPPAADAPSRWRTSLGLAGLHSPEYTGAADRDTRLFPYLSLRYGDAFSFTFFEGARLRVAGDQQWSAGLGLKPYFGRDEDDGPLLQGWGDIDPGLLPQVWLTWQQDNITLGLNHTRDLFETSHEGASSELSASYRWGLSRQFFITPGISLLHGNARYAQSLFGVTAAQAARSAASIPAFDADRGIVSHRFSLTALYFITRRWSALAFVRHRVLADDITDSPIVERKRLNTVGAAISYTF